MVVLPLVSPMSKDSVVSAWKFKLRVRTWISSLLSGLLVLSLSGNV
jgi:hypothetical protein